jgi:hypothetical protein
MERATDLTARERRICLVGVLPSTVNVKRYDGIERLSAMIDAIEEVIEHFAAGELPLANASPQLGGRQIGDTAHDDLLTRRRIPGRDIRSKDLRCSSHILLLFFRGEPQGTDEAGRFDDESL